MRPRIGEILDTSEVFYCCRYMMGRAMLSQQDMPIITRSFENEIFIETFPDACEKCRLVYCGTNLDYCENPFGTHKRKYVKLLHFIEGEYTNVKYYPFLKGCRRVCSNCLLQAKKRGSIRKKDEGLKLRLFKKIKCNLERMGLSKPVLQQAMQQIMAQPNVKIKKLICDNRSNEKKVISQKMITNLPDENQNSFCKSYDNQQFDLYENGKRKHKSDDNRSISSIGEDEPCASEYSDTDSTNECQDVSKSIYQSPTSYVPCLTINKEPSENIQKKKGNSQTCSEMKLTLKRDGFNHENWIALPKENYAYHNVISHTNEIFPRPQEKVLQTNIYKETPELDSNVYAAPIKRNSYNIKINLAPRPIFGSKLDNQRSNNMQSEENSIKFYQSSECEKKEHFLKDSNDTSNHNKENEYIGRDQSLKKQEEKFSSDHHSLKKQEELDNESKTTTLLQFESKKYTNVKLVAENKMYMNSDAHNIIENIQDKCNTNSAYSESKKKSLSNEALILIPNCLKAARYDSGTSSLTCIELPPDDDSDDENRLRINIDDFETDSMYNKHLKNDDSYAPENNSCINQGKNTTSDITNSQVSDPRRNKQEDSLNNDEQLKIDKTDTKIINGNDEKMEVEISITNESKAKTLNKESIFCDLYYFGEGIFDCLPEYHCYGEETRQELISEYTKLYQDGKKSKLLKINKKKAFYQKRKTSNGDKVVEPSCKNLKLDEPDIELDQSKSIQNINEITHMESAILNENANCVLEDESPLHELEGGDFDYNYSQIVRNKEFSDRNLNDDYCLSDDEPNNSIKQSNLISVETVNHGHENFIRQDHLLEKNLYEVISNSSAIPSSSTKEIEKLNDDNLSNSFKMNNVLPKKNAVNGQEDQSKLCINMQEEITKFNSTSTKIKIYINKDVNSEDIFGKSTVPTTNVYLNTSINHTSNKNNLMQSNRAIDNNLSEEVSNIFSCSSTETSKHEHVKVTNSEKSKEVTIEYNHGIIENIVHSDTVKKDYCDLKVLSSHNLVLENFLPSNESVPYNEEYYTYHSMLDSLVSEKNLIVQSNSLSSALFIPVYLPTIVTYQQLPTSSYISSNQSVSNLPVSTSSTNSSTNLSKASTMTNEIKILPKASPMSNNVSSKSTTPTTSSSSLLTLLSTALNKPFIPPMAEVPSDNQRNETIKSIIIRASDFFQMNEGKSISEKKCFKNKNVSTELEIMLNNQSGGEGMDNSIEEFTENPTLSIKNLMVAVQKLYIFLKENWDSESSKFESYEELGPNSFRFLKHLIEINRYLLYTQHILQTDFINTVKAVDKILNNKPSPPTLNCVIKLYKKLVKQNIIRHDAIHVIHIPDINTMSEIIIKQILQYEEIVKTNNELVEKSSKKENVKAYPKHKHRDFEK